ncbi:branched-chain amino acid ABC transporter permease [Haematobacter massiliensis]|uniref:ABC transporter permease n=1 Tax=Haematobacter massiliensis TaxID=195105 RepID=A0A086Y6N3_9RHOB|nr:branched-chain amino acid ABC transporter permease [Haematobacter massiliensis]KFI29933.1 ABC transporter permease [Haematobacter massiliensis]OWJ72929.1 branched-chain amino acid ABC transporter permease [Haematobacter massiliensis]OWJ81410.1 branched-chain amino acid ABC transporter permease [Haematobacter massiliensis]QBJ25440.1 branched-chain amino acid ABC transporter permease [Haematobacter massiliensis]
MATDIPFTQPAPVAARPTAVALEARALSNLGRTGRWKPAEFAFWALAAATFFLLPDKHLLLTEIAILGLFALSLDLILGYAGIVSLGHGAFFGLGAYVAGLVSVHLTGEPITGLLLAGAAAAVLGAATAPLLLLRASDLTRLMVTLGIAMLLLEAANKAAWLTGGADGLQGVWIDPLFGRFEFDLMGTTAYAYCLIVTFLLFLIARRVVTSPYGLSLRAIRDNTLRSATIGIPVGKRLVAIYALSAGIAGIAGGLLTQTTMFVSLDVLAFHRSADVLLVLVLGGVGYLYGGLIGAVVFKLLQDVLSNLTPQYWMFWIGLILVVIVLIGRDRINAAPRALWTRIRGGK